MSFLKVIIFSICMIIISIGIENAYGETITKKDILDICLEHQYENCTLVKAISWVETQNRPKDYNPEKTGSYGLMQIQCSTAEMLGYKKECSTLYSEEKNIELGIKYLRWLVRVHKIADIKSLIAAWNSGTPIVCKNWNKGKCYPGEFVNQQYVWNVMRHYKYLGGDTEWNPQKPSPSILAPQKKEITSIILQKRLHHTHKTMTNLKSLSQIESKNSSMGKSSLFTVDF